MPAPQTTKAIRINYLPEKKQWMELVKEALDEIRAGRLQKVVLARESQLELPFAPHPMAIAAALQKKSKGAALYCIQNDCGAFLGATPEKLFSRKGRFIESEALAGTQWEGAPFTDKEKREIDPVADFLQASLKPLCEDRLEFLPLEIYETGYLQHLKRSVRGKLYPHVLDSEIIDRLHPTPALGGAPQKNALQFIREMEPFQRGLYGGTIGWSHGDETECYVAIRSCWLEGKTARLHTGVGIVASSDPEREWEELNQKLKLYEGILL